MTDPRPRTPVIAVIGSAGRISDELAQDAYALGRLCMEHGWYLVTGGLDGVMASASRGARESPSWHEGRIVGILPTYNRETANPWCDLIIPTGAQLARNIAVVAMADVVVALAGGAGTLSEFAMAWQLGKPIVALTAHGGWSARLAGQNLDARRDDAIERAEDPREAMARVERILATRRVEPGDIGSGWQRPT